MKFLSAVLGKKADPDAEIPEEATEEVEFVDIPAMEPVAAATPSEPAAPAEPISAPAPSPTLEDDKPIKRAINIWDLEYGDEDAEAAPHMGRRRVEAMRINGTRATQSAGADGDAGRPMDSVKFPVGWLLVVRGKGRGNCIAMKAGMNQIGRGKDNAVRLDFGDKAISRNNHAGIVFDDEARKFVLGTGDKSNVVRLNGKPVLSKVALNDGDRIKVGKTTLRLRTLCGPEFVWSEDGDSSSAE